MRFGRFFVRVVIPKMPFFLLATSILILSQSANFIRYASAHAAAIGFWRLLMATVVLLPIVLYKKQWRQITHASTKIKLQILLTSILLYIHFFFWFLSVQKTSIANSMILFSTNPLFTAIGAWIFFREKMARRHFVALLFCFAGIFWMVKDSLAFNPEHFQGDVLGFFCAIAFSAYVLSGKSLRHKMDNPPFALATYFFCSLFFLATMLYLRLPMLQYDGKTWAAYAALAIGSTLLGHSLFTHCLQYFNVNLMSCSTLVEPIFSALMANYLFGEPIRNSAVVGFCFVSVGILTLYYPYLLALGGKKLVQEDRAAL